MPDERGRWSDEEVWTEEDRLGFIGGEPAEFVVRRTAEALIERHDVTHGSLVHVPVCPGDRISLMRKHIPHEIGGPGQLVLEAQIYTQLRAQGWKF